MNNLRRACHVAASRSAAISGVTLYKDDLNLLVLTLTPFILANTAAEFGASQFDVVPQDPE